MLGLVWQYPREPQVHEWLAYAYGNAGRMAECEAHLLTASHMPGCSPEALFYLGRVQLQSGRSRTAIASIHRSLQLAGEFFEGLHELGVAHSALGDHARALQCFRAAERWRPDCPELQHNLASTLWELREPQAALNHYDQALVLRPALQRAWSGRAAVLHALGRNAEALGSCERALAVANGDTDAWIQQARVLAALDRPQEAARSLRQLGTLPPMADYAHGDWLLRSMHACSWFGWEAVVEDTSRRVHAGEKAASPYTLLATPVDAATQLAAACTFARDRFPARPAAPRSAGRLADRKLRIGYFSPDFYNHATSQLIVGMLEEHARDRFEWFGFSTGPTAADAMTARVAKAFDHFVSVAYQSDDAAASMARDLGLDIAVDLNGFNEGARTGIFARRAAPLQVNYLGYPGTMGCDYIDYIVADEILIRPEDYPHYAEKAVLLPGCYQPNDRKKHIAPLVSDRATWGLPSDATVFACFNSVFKITPDVFDSWMRILSRVPGSVLWLLQGSPSCMETLRQEARRCRVAPERIVWAERAPLDMHLARHAHADLFLDTLYYNAHTTCSDALWAGLPVLTCEGKTFASRVAASLLHSVGLPELITHDLDEYEALATRLAAAPGRLQELRGRLRRHRDEAPLFDTARHACHLEAAYEAMWSRHRRGLAPDHLLMRLHDGAAICA